MKYICIKECCTINFDDLTLKQLFLPGRIYEVKGGKPDKRFFKRYRMKKNAK